jgi:hypothetical protein
LRSLQIKFVKKSKMFGFHCIDIYINRPQQFNDITFVEYFKQFEIDKKNSSQIINLMDKMILNYIYTKIVKSYNS